SRKKAKGQSSALAALEVSAVKELRKIMSDVDSPDAIRMYEAARELSIHPANKCLLPKAMDLLAHDIKNIQHAAFTMAAKNVFGPYMKGFFSALKTLNPAEREQVLQSLQERFSQMGGPTSSVEQKKWVTEFESLGKEHQPTVFSLMRWLGPPGAKWIAGQIREHTSTISLGAVPVLNGFPDKTKKNFIRLLCQHASKKKRQMLPEICGIVDSGTVSQLALFLKGSTWQERVHIAEAIARVGIKKTTQLVMELVGDPDWQVKQALVENLNITDSTFASLVKVLGYLVTETHSRVRSQTERTILRLGSEACANSTIEAQRQVLERKFRSQLLRAAKANRDLDTKWLGVDYEKPDPMSEILRQVAETPEQKSKEDVARPEGVSLADFEKETEETSSPSESSDEKATLLAALMGAKKAAQEETPQASEPEDVPLDATLPTTSRFILLLQKSTETHGKDVPLNVLLDEASSYSLSDEEFFVALTELEKQGIIYRSSRGTVSYVDLDV
ncbi:MAG: HEAT repeat domain-containing protein, partial [Candidatus Thorarchaeota archaeon]